MDTPIIGTTCPALTKENYEYRFSGDCGAFCICAMNDQPCIGRIIEDPEDRSSQFFSRGRCGIDKDKLNDCPAYGLSKETFAKIITEKAHKELNEKLKTIG